MVGINQLMSGRRYVRQNSQPPKGINALKGLKHVVGNCHPTRAVKTIAPRHKIAIEPMLSSILFPSQEGPFAIDIMQHGLIRIPDHMHSAWLGRVEQIPHYLLLSVDGYGGATGQIRQIDMNDLTVQ